MAHCKIYIGSGNKTCLEKEVNDIRRLIRNHGVWAVEAALISLLLGEMS